ncbi:MAG: S-layer homology domain-containing protein [Nostocaceae cyanobacterium]|nr:S-layer homology domain-containing protein [Nostocaceae cyanobacterium]
MVQSTLISTIYVNPATGNDAASGSRGLPWKTLSRALRQASNGTIIQLATGTYNAASGEVFPLVIPAGVMVVGNEATNGKGILIQGSGEYASSTFGTQNITLLLLSNAQLLGVTVTNPVNKGTGVWIESTAPTLANNTFAQCSREGVFVTGTAKPAIFGNVFWQNAASGLMLARNSKAEVVRNLFQETGFGIAISDAAAPFISDNKLVANRTGIVLSRDARPVLRNNILEKNTNGGLIVNGNAIPDLGSKQDPAGNIFRNNGEFDFQNATSVALVCVGNQLNPAQVKGDVNLQAATEDTPATASFISNFPDVQGHWAAAFIQAMVDKGLLSGFPNGTFQPEAPITRAQYAAVIAKTFNQPISNKSSNFTDIADNFWATPAIMRAARMGFISGFGDGSFRPGQNLTRVQAIVSIVNGLKLTGGNPNGLNRMSDRAQIPSYATNAVTTAIQKLLVVNYPQTDQLEPLRDITRAEVAAIIYQALVALGQSDPIASAYIVQPEADVPSFSDLQGHWAESFIRGLVSINVTRGFSDGKYQPEAPMTRAQYTALITAAFNPTPKRPDREFKDVPRDFWARNAIQQAARGGFVGGFPNQTFKPSQNVSRLQVIVSLVNGLELQGGNGNTVKFFTDYNAIPESVQKYVATATAQGIVVNYPNPKQFQPNREATRAEVAAMVYQALVAINRLNAISSAYIASP